MKPDASNSNHNKNAFCRRTRREFLWEAGGGFTGLALTGLLSLDKFFTSTASAAVSSANPLAPHPAHFPAKAKNVIFLFMYGGPSHVDTFDYKPKLYGLDGKTIEVKNVWTWWQEKSRPGRGTEMEFQAVRPVRQICQRPLSKPRNLRG